MANRSLIGAGAVVTAALIASGVTYAVAGDHGERGTVELVDVSTTPSPSVTAEPAVEPAPQPETTTTTATVEPEPAVTSVAPPPEEEPVSEPVVEPKPPESEPESTTQYVGPQGPAVSGTIDNPIPPPPPADPPGSYGYVIDPTPSPAP